MSSSQVVEEVVAFRCEQSRLWGILTRPSSAAATARIATLIVVGGPQYRVGSHRQFVLLARSMASAGFPSLRFDYRGMGDSEGVVRDFEAIGPDLRAALDALSAACPGARELVVWGLCDAASAALMHATSDAQVVGIVAVNPWARSTVSLAAARVRHYYLSRLAQREFWTKLLGRGVHLGAALRSFASNLREGYIPGSKDAKSPCGDSFQDRMASGLARFRGQVLLILSGNDLTAKEFLQHAESAAAWRGLLAGPKITRFDLPDADHTFSLRAWFDAVEDETVSWLNRLAESSAPRVSGGPGDAMQPRGEATQA